MIGSIIAASARMSVAYAERMLKDIPPSQFARFAEAGGQVIESNHPAFIFGHLSLYPCRVVSEVGGDASAITPSSKFEALFSPSAKCLDDPDGTLYPSMDEITSKFFKAHEVAIEVLMTCDDAVFAGENPNERMRPKFATIGAAHAFYLGGHAMLHMGQLSAWRRAVGLGPG
ncbi:DinB family protein [Aporhodopirellula aestuarii]|uniref:DinB family protein n=1 Tax=Aporhodopirellula aestuarii TaxID=2950107 RepID=A0ABT0TZ79_9BACT|nr:DinB family protein [Aporhodopirellula aestuarii]MCM2369918.1 DinB family protein [Aporhodopirellula aestuarii]